MMSVPPDRSYYEDMQGKLQALLIAVESQLSDDERSLFAELIDSNELGVTLEMIVEALANSRQAIDATVVEKVDQLATAMGMVEIVGILEGRPDGQ